MSSIINQLGAGLLKVAAAELTTLEPTIVAGADTGISNVATQAKAAIDKALTGHGALSIFAKELTGPVNDAIDNLARTVLEPDVASLISVGIKTLSNEAAQLA